MKQPKNITRTTFDRVGFDSLPNSCVYVLAYMRKIVYVGKTANSATNRLMGHVGNVRERKELLGRWLIVNADHVNVRVDCLETPDSVDEQAWLRETEIACIRKFKPLFNETYNCA